MNKTRNQRRRKAGPPSASAHPTDKQRIYRKPLPSKPVTALLQQLLDTVVVLTDTVTSAVDLYKQSHKQPATTVAAPPPATLLATSTRLTETVTSAVELYKKSHEPLLAKSEPTNNSPAPTNKNKRPRSTVSSSDSADDLASYMNDEDEILTYVLLPGERRGVSQLMYVLDDKNLYVRRYSFQNYDRYVCQAPACRCTVQLTKPAGIARRVGDRTSTHQHPDMAREYAELTKDDIITPTSAQPPTAAGSDGRRSGRARAASIKPTPSTSARSPSLQPAAIKTEIDIEEHVWAEMLSMEEDNNDESDVDYEENQTSQDKKVKKKKVRRRSVREEQPQDDSEDGDEDMTFEFVPGSRLQSRLLYTLDEKHMYRRSSSTPTYDRYVCISRVCRACVRFYRKENAVRRGGNAKVKQHTHPNAEERYHANKFLNGVKQDILNSGGTHSAVEIYETHAENNAQIAQIVPFGQIKNTLRKFKSRNQQLKNMESPLTLDGVAFAYHSTDTYDRYGRTRPLGDEPRTDFYRGTVVTETFGFCVFASDAVVRHVSQAPAAERHYHIDGTTDFLPENEFRQMIIVFWEHKNNVFPVVYALLTKRTTAAYVAMFQYVEEHVCQLVPVSITCDYNMSLRNALRRMYSHCVRRPNHFNLVQAARQYAHSLPQFFEPINTDANQCRVYHKFMHLPVLPAELMAYGFQVLLAECSSFGPPFRMFVEYVRRTWIEPPGGPISVVGCESSAAKLVEMCVMAMRPKFRAGRKFFQFVDDLVKDEAMKVEQLQQLTTGSGHVELAKQKNTGVRHWNNIAKMQQKLLDGLTTADEFLQALTNNTSALNMSSESHQTWDEDEDADAAEDEFDWPLCETCGEAERQKVVLQPCGHVCHQCHVARLPIRNVVCPLCNGHVRGSFLF